MGDIYLRGLLLKSTQQFPVLEPHHCGLVGTVLIGKLLRPLEDDFGVTSDPSAVARVSVCCRVLPDRPERFMAFKPVGDERYVADSLGRSWHSAEDAEECFVGSIRVSQRYLGAFQGFSWVI